MTKLSKQFFYRDTVIVAQELLGKYFVSNLKDGKVVGKIVETEAYKGIDDLACHASKGKTNRTEALFGETGRLYIYLNYGIFWLTNIVAHRDGVGAVLIRAAEITEGFDLVNNRLSNHRFVKPNDKPASGPGKFSVAFGINKDFHKEDVTESCKIYIEDRGVTISKFDLVESKRIGVDYAGHCKDFLWRYYIKNNTYISKK